MPHPLPIFEGRYPRLSTLLYVLDWRVGTVGEERARWDRCLTLLMAGHDPAHHPEAWM